jgi:hypothetical protein
MTRIMQSGYQIDIALRHRNNAVKKDDVQSCMIKRHLSNHVGASRRKAGGIIN